MRDMLPLPPLPGIPQQRNEALDRQTPQDLLPIGAGGGSDRSQ